jgi:hypothetical protein
LRTDQPYHFYCALHREIFKFGLLLKFELRALQHFVHWLWCAPLLYKLSRHQV